jgi:hypothetical protein
MVTNEDVLLALGWTECKYCKAQGRHGWSTPGEHSCLTPPDFLQDVCANMSLVDRADDFTLFSRPDGTKHVELWFGKHGTQGVRYGRGVNEDLRVAIAEAFVMAHREPPIT